MVDGKIIYRPDNNFSGSDTLAYTVSDTSSLLSNIAEVGINVSGSNAAPIVANDSASTAEDTAVTINVLDNDSDSDGQLDVGTVFIVRQPSHGTVTASSNGSVTYTPDTNFNGSDSLSYAVKDTAGALSAEATVSVTITAVNDAPEALNDTLAVKDNTSPHFVNVLGNDKDVDSTSVTVKLLNNPTNGSVTISTDGNQVLTFTPATGFSGTDSFTYQLEDGNSALSAVATVTVTSTVPNQPPGANDDSAQTSEDQLVTIDVLANDIDSDGILNSSSVSITAQPGQGTASVDPADGRIFYQPNTNYNGDDVLTYQVSDNSGGTATAKVHLRINPVDDAPTATSQGVTVAEDSSVNFTLSGADAEGSTIEYTIDSYPKHGTLTGTLPNLTFTPVDNYNGSDSMAFHINDGATDSAIASVTFHRHPGQRYPHGGQPNLASQ